MSRATNSVSAREPLERSRHAFAGLLRAGAAPPEFCPHLVQDGEAAPILTFDLTMASHLRIEAPRIAERICASTRSESVRAADRIPIACLVRPPLCSYSPAENRLSTGYAGFALPMPVHPRHHCPEQPPMRCAAISRLFQNDRPSVPPALHF